ncbi:MAG: ComF family protein [Flavobacteriaceae bacterium]|jgi:ComF family protein|nr:ComF family protein [Flavobacteriaceae bacterium]
MNCGLITPDAQEFLCEKCKNSLPLTGMILGSDNEIHAKINETTRVKYASSLLFFHQENIAQTLIHHMKYKNFPELGTLLAEIWLEENKNNPVLSEIESVIPVPIHAKRERKRGYNQVELCTQWLAERLNCKFDNQALVRVHHLESQTKSGKYERLERMKNAFRRTNSEAKHYLLVDDVFTTGATLTACTEELLKIPETEVSIFTLAKVR